jgi:hypothetical protein
MPIYEYRCECGAILEAIERVGATRAECGELCKREGAQQGAGKVERILSSNALRGDGREAAEPTIDVKKRSGRWWDDCA